MPGFSRPARTFPIQILKILIEIGIKFSFVIGGSVFRVAIVCTIFPNRIDIDTVFIEDLA